MSTANLTHAIWLGSRQGLHIFPLYPVRTDGEKPACACNDGANCKRIGTHPIHDDFASVATCDENAIRLLWEPCPDAQIALLTGQKSGIVALEIRPTDENPNPLRGYAVPSAPAIVCAGKTVRLYGAPDEPIEKRRDLGNGLALRGENSYVVLPEAIAANGEKYEWAPGQTLQMTRISPLPSEFVNPPRHDEPEFTAEWHGTDNQPTPEDLNAWNEEQTYHDAEPRDSVNRDEPEIKAQWSGTERQHEAQPAANTARKTGAISLGELMESEDSSDATICAPLGISFGDRPMLIVGAFGTAKTWIMIKLALEFATGRPLFGNSAWPIPRPLRVFIFDYELSIKAYKKRIRQLCETMGIDYQTIRERIYYYQRPKFYLTDPNAYDRFLEETKDFDIILGDALRGAAPDVDENKSEFRKNLDILHDVATTGNRFVCWLHHAGKDGNRGFRGTSGIGDAAGVMFTVTNDDKDRKGPKKFHHDKLGPNGDDFVDDFFIQLRKDGEDGNGPMRITSMTEEEAKKQAEAEPMEKEEWLDTKKKILKKLQSSAGISRNELYDAVKGNRATFDKVLKHLVEKLRYVENQGAATNHKYVITTAGQEWLDKGSRYARHTPGPNAPTNPNKAHASDDAPPPIETTPEQPNETNTMKNQSDAVDANIKMVVEYVRDNPGCTKSMVNHNIGIRGERAKAARDTAEYKKLIEFDGTGYRVTDKGKALPGLPPSIVTTPPSAPHDAPPTPGTNANPNDAPKDP